MDNDSPNKQPGVLFDIHLSTPKERVQAYLDSYRRIGNGDTAQETFDGPLLSTHITLIAATVTSLTHAVVTFAVNVHPTLCNRTRRLHGAAAALIFDMQASRLFSDTVAEIFTIEVAFVLFQKHALRLLVMQSPSEDLDHLTECMADKRKRCTTMAVAPLARADFWHFGGFSRTLSITYFRPVEEGSRVVVECEVVQIGRTLATIHGKMTRESDGVLLCFAEHNKAAVDLTVPRSKMKL